MLFYLFFVCETKIGQCFSAKKKITNKKSRKRNRCEEKKWTNVCLHRNLDVTQLIKTWSAKAKTKQIHRCIPFAIRLFRFVFPVFVLIVCVDHMPVETFTNAKHININLDITSTRGQTIFLNIYLCSSTGGTRY